MMYSSGLLMTYGMLSLNDMRLRLARRKMQDAEQQRGAIAAFRSMKEASYELLGALEGIYGAGPGRIWHEAVRERMLRRTDLWAVKVATCMYCFFCCSCLCEV